MIISSLSPATLGPAREEINPSPDPELLEMSRKGLQNLMRELGLR
jgi:hypothetical protein